jgi:hypothetical protein
MEFITIPKRHSEIINHFTALHNIYAKRKIVKSFPLGCYNYNKARQEFAFEVFKNRLYLKDFQYIKLMNSI